MSIAWAKIAQSIGVKGFISIGLAVALALSIWNASVISGKLDTKRDELAAERAGHAITRNSVETLQASLAKFVGAGQASRISQLAAIEAQAKENADMQADADAIRAEMATLADDGSCASPSSILRSENL